MTYYAIVTRYSGASNSRGSRIFATCEGSRLSIDYPHHASAGAPAHRIAAEALAARMGWANPAGLVGGALREGRYCWVRADSDVAQIPAGAARVRLTIDARTDDPDGFARAACAHLVETFNDDSSILSADPA